jgi:hypothetical protein
MSARILRRCTICNKFHASYLVPDEEGNPAYYCYDCWQTRFALPGFTGLDKGPEQPGTLKDANKSERKPEK